MNGLRHTTSISAAEIRRELAQTGVSCIHARSGGEAGALMSLGGLLGDPVPYRGQLLTRLLPRTRSRGARRSLTKSFGMGEFPFHSDDVVSPVPVRFVLLACVEPGSVACPTRYCYLDTEFLPEDAMMRLRRATFVVRSGRCSFHTAIPHARLRPLRHELHEACVSGVQDGRVRHEGLDCGGPQQLRSIGAPARLPSLTTGGVFIRGAIAADPSRLLLRLYIR